MILRWSYVQSIWEGNKKCLPSGIERFRWHIRSGKELFDSSTVATLVSWDDWSRLFDRYLDSEGDCLMNAKSIRFCCAPNGPERLPSTCIGWKSLSCSLISFRSTVYYGMQLSLGPGECLLVRFGSVTSLPTCLALRIWLLLHPLLLQFLSLSFT
jgi:hypothetical protein